MLFDLDYMIRIDHVAVAPAALSALAVRDNVRIALTGRTVTFTGPVWHDLEHARAVLFTALIEATR